MMSDRKAKKVAEGGIIACLYLVLTLLSNSLGLANGLIQLRLSEVLCILPIFTPSAVPGLFVGCLTANLITGCAPWDVVFGSLATLLAAAVTRKLRDRKGIRLLPPVIFNALMIPPILSRVYGFPQALSVLILAILFSETLSAGIFGSILLRTVEKRKDIFKFS